MTESHVTLRLIKGEREEPMSPVLRDVIATGSCLLTSHTPAILSCPDQTAVAPVERSHRSLLLSQVPCHVVNAIVCDARLLPAIVWGSMRNGCS